MAMNMGIIAMLGVVVGVLAAFASFFIYLMRRAKLRARPDDSVWKGSLNAELARDAVAGVGARRARSTR